MHDNIKPYERLINRMTQAIPLQRPTNSQSDCRMSKCVDGILRAIVNNYYVNIPVGPSIDYFYRLNKPFYSSHVLWNTISFVRYTLLSKCRGHCDIVQWVLHDTTMPTVVEVSCDFPQLWRLLDNASTLLYTLRSPLWDWIPSSSTCHHRPPLLHPVFHRYTLSVCKIKLKLITTHTIVTY